LKGQHPILPNLTEAIAEYTVTPRRTLGMTTSGTVPDGQQNMIVGGIVEVKASHPSTLKVRW
jgi:hypothetical protein